MILIAIPPPAAQIKRQVSAIKLFRHLVRCFQGSVNLHLDVFLTSIVTPTFDRKVLGVHVQNHTSKSYAPVCAFLSIKALVSPSHVNTAAAAIITSSSHIFRLSKPISPRRSLDRVGLRAISRTRPVAEAGSVCSPQDLCGGMSALWSGARQGTCKDGDKKAMVVLHIVIDECSVFNVCHGRPSERLAHHCPLMSRASSGHRLFTRASNTALASSNLNTLPCDGSGLDRSSSLKNGHLVASKKKPAWSRKHT